VNTVTTPTFDKRELRTVLGTFVTGVTVVTTRAAEGKLYGVTANSFSSVSLDPPLVLWSQSVSSSSHPAFRDTDHFVVNILSDDQVHLSDHFAKSKADKFVDVAYSDGIGGAPVLHGTAAHLECVKVATYPGGDHVVYLGRVERITQGGRRPLAFGQGRYMVPYAHDLGPMSLGLGQAPPASTEAVRIATEAMPAISKVLGDHTLCLSVWGNHGPTAVRFEPGAQPVSADLRTGLVVSVTRSAVGRAFAAFLPAEITRSFIEEDLRLSHSSVESEAVQRATFEAEVEQARLSGLARSADPEPSPLQGIAVTAFSAPIRDAQGRMTMALTVISQAARLSPDRDAEVPTLLARAAAAITDQLNECAKADVIQKETELEVGR
jgi:flavin reductase (DIM6/NTAB) family NADH-FMN oxidoreductase RutF/DNA-binding IclR family transcriptional regulator